ncbi:hypothetical protein QJ036_07445 [Ruminococcus sp. YH-rum2234]|uniref:Uncharacterized protein n=1 Tax=Fusibacillus kribbianus TaxID=3044208 RepID=A0AAP4BBU2_9FIRM|nr:hypothetical protein [Ruminococcus sp. YH-rum2234]
MENLEIDWDNKCKEREPVKTYGYSEMHSEQSGSRLQEKSRTSSGNLVQVLLAIQTVWTAFLPSRGQV